MSNDAKCIDMPILNVTNLYPGTLHQIKEVLRGKHPDKEVKVLYRVGGEVVYLVNGRIKGI